MATDNPDVERPRRDLGNAWIWILALGAPMLVVVLIDRDQTAVTPVAVVTYGILSVACFAIGMHVNRASVVRTLVAFGAALSLFVLADLVGYVISPSAATVIFIAAYCCCGIGLVPAVAAIRPGHDRRAIVDAALLSLLLLAVVWRVIVEAPHVSLGAASFPELTSLVVTPILDTALLAVTVSLLLRAGTIRTTAGVLLTCALILTFPSDVLAGHFAARDQLGPAIAWAGLGVLGYGLFAATALHTSVRNLFAPRSERGELEIVRFVLVAMAPIVPTVLLVWDIATTGGAPSPVLPLLTAACFALSGFRLADLLTRERAAAEVLREQNARLVQLNEMKQSFISMVSHELRTPLTSIVGYLEFLSEGEGGELTAEQAHFVSVIERNAGRLQALVDEILQLGRADEGRIKLTVEPVDVARLVRRAAESAGPIAELKGLTLAAEVAPELPDLSGDRRLLAQALDNLVSNAIKFTPAGGAVTVRARPAGEGVELEVEDSGVGIPADELPRLFERFFRASTASVSSGTGLGLAIVRSIADLHGGTISVNSTVGVGSTFRLTLPVAPPARREARAIETLKA